MSKIFDLITIQSALVFAAGEWRKDLQHNQLSLIHISRASWIPKSARKEHKTALVLYERRDDNAVTTPAQGGKHS